MITMRSSDLIPRTDKPRIDRPALVAQAAAARLEYIAQQSGLAGYIPHPKQAQFHESGERYRYRMFSGGNRSGKTKGGGSEIAMHVTGNYPDWWKGRRFDEPLRVWAAGVTTESVRDIIQAELIGSLDEGAESYGKGAIGREYIVGIDKRRGVPNALDTVYVQHPKGVSEVGFKSYDMGRAKFQGTSKHIVWLDEEPPIEIYRECQQRIVDTAGFMMLTMTPLMGMTEVCGLFFKPEFRNDERLLIKVQQDENPHLSDKMKAEIRADLPEHEAQSRLYGIPQLGEGMVFNTPLDSLWCDPFEVPVWYRRIGGMDFGWDHPFAAVELAHDPDTDTVYLTREYSARKQTPAEHSIMLMHWGIRWAWPHDGLNHEKGSGEQLKQKYSDAGLDMLADKATHLTGGNSVETGITDMRMRMKSGRFKVFRGCQRWGQEYVGYHRKGGKIVKVDDDLLDASRYGLMMLRFAQAPDEMLDEITTVAY